MKNFICILECGHEIQWTENPFTPGADLPHVGRIVFCQDCEEDQEVVRILPEEITVETIIINEETKLHIFYDSTEGNWGYCFSEKDNNGLYFESDDVVGFLSLKEAKEAALDWYNSLG